MTLTVAQRPAAPSPAEATDEELLLRYRDVADVEAFETLVHRYERPIYLYLLRYLRSPALAEEVFQATFLRVHEKCHLFTADRPARPWLYSLATHLAIDALRKEGRHHVASLDRPYEDEEGGVGALVDLLRSPIPSPLERLEANERAQWAQQAVDELPDHQRVAILLVFFQGLKYHEVAEILQLPLGTVKSRVHKALVALNAAWRRDHPKGETD
jgi:RNA polymerase sigma-70 factor (ECF subfamily)